MFKVCVIAISVLTLQVTLSLLYDCPLDLPERCDNGPVCFMPACHAERCTRFPEAICRNYCNSCVARFFIGNMHITPLCGNQQ
uniref:ShKT domain-containing protein n=1 Tax=Magallana gigas TaxID=29159 RepID=A0A8W8NZX9_MAGGI